MVLVGVKEFEGTVGRSGTVGSVRTKRVSGISRTA